MVSNIEIDKIYNEDCLSGLRKIEANTISLTITQSPYSQIESFGPASSSMAYDRFKLVADEIFRVTKIGGIVIWITIDQAKNGEKEGLEFKEALYFKQIGFRFCDTTTKDNDAQMFIFVKGPLPTYPHAAFRDSLVKYYIENWTQKDDIVLDPFSNDNSVAKIAKSLKRHFFAFDINKELKENIMYYFVSENLEETIRNVETELSEEEQLERNGELFTSEETHATDSTVADDVDKRQEMSKENESFDLLKRALVKGLSGRFEAFLLGTIEMGLRLIEKENKTVKMAENANEAHKEELPKEEKPKKKYRARKKKEAIVETTAPEEKKEDAVTAVEETQNVEEPAATNEPIEAEQAFNSAEMPVSQIKKKRGRPKKAQATE